MRKARAQLKQTNLNQFGYRKCLNDFAKLKYLIVFYNHNLENFGIFIIFILEFGFFVLKWRKY